MAILPDNEYTEFENRSYLNPQVALDEQNAFIDNLRQTQQANNQQIKTDTYNLGTAVPSDLGGLTGGEGYFTARYQTPQTNNLLNDLRATAQASALNQVLSNEQTKWKKRYNDAMNSAKVRSARASKSSGSLPGLTGNTTGNVDTEDNTNDANHKWEEGDTPVTYSHDVGRGGGWGEFSDAWTGEYNYSLPGGIEVNLGGWDDQLMYGSDGLYYIYNSKNNTYTPVLGDSGKSEGGTKWWKK